MQSIGLLKIFQIYLERNRNVFMLFYSLFWIIEMKYVDTYHLSKEACLLTPKCYDLIRILNTLP